MVEKNLRLMVTLLLKKSVMADISVRYIADLLKITKYKAEKVMQLVKSLTLPAKKCSILTNCFSVLPSDKNKIEKKDEKVTNITSEWPLLIIPESIKINGNINIYNFLLNEKKSRSCVSEHVDNKLQFFKKRTVYLLII